MGEHYFEAFRSLVEGFTLSPVSGEPEEGTEDEIRRYRLLSLIKQVRSMAMRKFYSMPAPFAVNHEMDDWIQEAAIIMFQCCESYDHRGPFDYYVRFMVSRRLISLQRKIFRENPASNQALLKIIQDLKLDLKREPTPDEVAEHTGRPLEEIEPQMAQGFGLRLVVRGEDLKGQALEDHDSLTDLDREAGVQHSKKNDPIEAKPGISAEIQYCQQEARRILRWCLEQLAPEAKLQFIRHEFNRVSFRKLNQRLAITGMSLATFKRRYQSEIYEPVKSCVESRYQIKS
jgi:RNA polymerase sigma factor (sigma-70 family)